jgi:hypothetical protein
VPNPLRLYLDGNIYNLLDHDLPTRELAARLAVTHRVEFVASPVLMGELSSSPFKGLPNWFPVKVLPEGIAIFGVARSGMARASEGLVSSSTWVSRERAQTRSSRTPRALWGPCSSLKTTAVASDLRLSPVPGMR